MSRTIFSFFLGVGLLLSGQIFAGDRLSVVTCFFTGKWAPGGFSEFEKQLKLNKILNQKYGNINTIDICLGSGSGFEELRSGWEVIDTIKKSFESNLDIKNLVKTYQPKKPAVALVLSSVSAVLVRCAIQKYGGLLPFIPKHLISICGPQVGIYSVPPDMVSDNPIEKACIAAQKFTTDSIMKETVEKLPFGSFFSAPASYFSSYLTPNYMASIAYQTLYQEWVQKKWISLWRDPYNLKKYQDCSYKKFPPFLPLFNNEPSVQDSITYKKKLDKYKKNIGLIDYFDFIAAKDDKFILPETALCQEEEVVGNAKTYKKSDVFLNRIGVDPKKAQFHIIEKAGHQCHTNPDIIKATVECIVNRW